MLPDLSPLAECRTAALRQYGYPVTVTLAPSEASALRINKTQEVATDAQGKRRYARANRLTRPGSLLHSTTVKPWSSTRRGRELVS